MGKAVVQIISRASGVWYHRYFSPISPVHPATEASR